jgi:hypothetical protein
MSTISASNSNQTFGDLCELLSDVNSFTILFQVLSDPEMSGAFNPDVLGYGVRLSSESRRILTNSRSDPLCLGVIINICAGANKSLPVPCNNTEL